MSCGLDFVLLPIGDNFIPHWARNLHSIRNWYEQREKEDLSLMVCSDPPQRAHVWVTCQVPSRLPEYVNRSIELQENKKIKSSWNIRDSHEKSLASVNLQDWGWWVCGTIFKRMLGVEILLRKIPPHPPPSTRRGVSGKITISGRAFSWEFTVCNSQTWKLECMFFVAQDPPQKRTYAVCKPYSNLLLKNPSISLVVHSKSHLKMESRSENQYNWLFLEEKTE